MFYHLVFKLFDHGYNYPPLTGLHPVQDLYSDSTRNDLEKIMADRAMNRIRLATYLDQEFRLLRARPTTRTKLKFIISAAKQMAPMESQLSGFYFLYIEAWLHTSIFKADTAMYSILPSPVPFTQGKPKLPSRILKLSGRDPGQVCLVESAPDQVGCYFALSHRWGESKKLLLTLKNLVRLKNGISFRLLPKTFRDAVEVTSRFGCSFLWIDCLCIVQDDINDWLRESTQMANIYHQATCVIDAHSAQDDNEGFLFTSRPSPIPTRASEDYARFHELVNESGLSQRGWVFQERILGKRHLHFTKGSLILEDASGIAVVNKKGLVRLSNDLPNQLNMEDAFHNMGQWSKLVERYSRCELTYDTDRLPAITGLARIFGERTGSGNFMFGLWSESIHCGLLWMQTAENPVRVRDAYQPGQRCPTWSWAAWKGCVTFPPCVEALESLVELPQERGVPSDVLMLENLGFQNPTLTIRGRLRTLSDIRVVYMKGSSKSTAECCKFVSPNLQNTMYTFAFFDGLHPGDKRTFGRLTLLLIAQHCNKGQFQDWDGYDVTITVSHTYFYLILEQEGENGYYRRIGTGSVLSANIWKHAPKVIVGVI